MHSVNPPSAKESCTLKRLIVCYVHFASLKIKVMAIFERQLWTESEESVPSPPTGSL